MTQTALKKIINIVLVICMENDFIGPKGLVSDREIAHLRLHGGARASLRILGTADGPTPLDDFLEVIHGDDNTYVIYVEDQHENDSETAAHFTAFGVHCINGTDGVKPVGRLAEFQGVRRSQVIATGVLNLATHAPIVEAITAIIRENELDDSTQVRFVVLGGLTDVLVADAARGFNHVANLPNPYGEGRDPWSFFGQVIVPTKYVFSNNVSDHEAAIRSMQKVLIATPKTDAETFALMGITA